MHTFLLPCFRRQTARSILPMAGLYLHIPFCTQRCVYCDFYFVTTKQSHATYVQALCAEIEHAALAHAKQEPVETIYFGGGTPSLLLLDEIQQILNTIHTHFDTSALHEVTLELNPEDANLDYLRGLCLLGINRLSVGIQSFFAADLAFMNRSHTVEQAEQAIPLIQRAGFDNFSVDLIFGVPNQPEEYWAANLQKAIQHEVPHLSTYGLTIEPQTPLYKQIELGKVEAPDDETMTYRYRFTINYLQEQGYEHYEVSSFARPGYRAQHNQLYWSHQNYLGFGPSAHSFWWKGLPAYRWANVRNIKRYEAFLGQRHMPLDFRETLDLDTLGNEYLMLRLRTSDGLDLDYLEQHYGIDLLIEKVDALAELESEAFLAPIRGNHIRLTDKGKMVCNAVTKKLLIDEATR